MDDAYCLLHGDCRERLQSLHDNSIDAIVTDPPYGLAFMGKKWDYDVPSADIWRECLRVLKPGGHLLAFAGTRTQHRMACNIEDAGFDIRDMIAWVYGSGFPKSLDVSKALDKAAGAEREVLGQVTKGSSPLPNNHDGTWSDGQVDGTFNITAPATDAARQWDGWGTALKPAMEPITVARKPLCGTVAENVLRHGTGGINVDGCRVGDGQTITIRGKTQTSPSEWVSVGAEDVVYKTNPPGRWPANLIHDGSKEVVGLFPNSKSSGGQASLGAFRNGDIYGKGRDEREVRDPGYGDSGSAARFFYCAKASKRDRDEGCDGLEEREAIGGMKATGLCRKCGRQKVNTSGECQCPEPDFGPIQRRRTNHHPTVKPTDLMRYLCRLVTPPGGTVLDPFMGSGSTGKAAMLEGFRFIGIEREAEYVEIAKARIQAAIQFPHE